MKTLVFALLSMLLVIGVVIAPSQAGVVITPIQAASPSLGELMFVKFIGGTIESVDPAGLRVTILTELGGKESFAVADESVLMGLTNGDRVSVEMDDQGIVKKIVKTTPDLKGKPAPEPKG